MALLVADCPRCSVQKITFDVRAQNPLNESQYELFSICRACSQSVVFRVYVKQVDAINVIRSGPDKLISIGGALNEIVAVDSYVGVRDLRIMKAPDHVPRDIAAAFEEGSTCTSVQCYNGAGTMFRLCLDHATRRLLPNASEPNAAEPRDYVRRNLSARLTWLFDNGRLPIEFRELAKCVREDGNDGAHAGTLIKADADDLLDFTVALLTRLYTEPERLRLAEQRRLQRREK